MTLMADGDEPEDDEVIIMAERAVGGKGLCEFFPRLVRKSKPLSTAGATGTKPETVSEPEDGSDKEEDQGQGESTGITSGLEPQTIITDEHEFREVGVGADNEVIENTFHVDGMTTLADPDLDRPKVPVTRSGSVGKVPKNPKVTNPGPVPKEKLTKGSKGKPKSRKKRKAPILTEAMQTDHAGYDFRATLLDTRLFQ